MAKRGPKKKIVDSKQIEKLAKIGCSQEEIGYILNISPDTIMRNYADAYKRGYAELKQSLRRKQVQMALKGDKTMLVWLGKQYLGQKERNEISTEDDKPLISIGVVQVDYRQVLAPVLTLPNPSTAIAGGSIEDSRPSGEDESLADGAEVG